MEGLIGLCVVLCGFCLVVAVAKGIAGVIAPRSIEQQTLDELRAANRAQAWRSTSNCLGGVSCISGCLILIVVLGLIALLSKL